MSFASSLTVSCNPNIQGSDKRISKKDHGSEPAKAVREEALDDMQDFISSDINDFEVMYQLLSANNNKSLPVEDQAMYKKVSLYYISLLVSLVVPHLMLGEKQITGRDFVSNPSFMDDYFAECGMTDESDEVYRNKLIQMVRFFFIRIIAHGKLVIVTCV
jgi:hypothetical protein